MRASPATVPDSEGAVNPREQALAQSKLEGNLLLSEIKLKQLKAERLKAADEKEALQREYNSLLEEKQALEKDHLRAEHERLKVAKALIDIEVEGNAQTATLEAQVAELKSQLLALERDKRELAGEREAAEKLLEQRAAELRAAEGDKEDLTSELIAVRVTLEQQQRAADEIAAKQGALDLEVVSSVNTAEQRKGHKGDPVIINEHVPLISGEIQAAFSLPSIPPVIEGVPAEACQQRDQPLRHPLLNRLALALRIQA